MNLGILGLVFAESPLGTRPSVSAGTSLVGTLGLRAIAPGTVTIILTDAGTSVGTTVRRDVQTNALGSKICAAEVAALVDQSSWAWAHHDRPYS